MVEHGARMFGRRRALALVREFLERPEQDGRPRSRRVPVLVFIGPRGSGKTTLVAELARQLDDRVPHARIDFRTTTEIPTNTVIPTLALLTNLVFELNRPCGRYGTLSFPRFIVGELSMYQTLHSADRKKARAQVERILEEHRNIDKLSVFLEALASRRHID